MRVLFFLFFLFFFPGIGSALACYSPYTSDNSLTMWADSTYHDDVFYSLRIEGTGQGDLVLKNGSGGEIDRLTISISASQKTYNFDTPSAGFKFDLTSGKVWAVSASTSNPLDPSPCWDRPRDWEQYMSGGSGGGGSGDLVIVEITNWDYIEADDVYRIQYSGWPQGVAWYELYFEGHTRSYVSDPIEMEPTGVHYLTCNGSYWLRFYDEDDNLVAISEEFVTTEIQNPVCSSYAGDPTGGDETGGGSCPCCDEVLAVLDDLEDAVDSQGYQLDRMAALQDQMYGAIQQQGYQLQAIQDTMNMISGKLDGVNSRLDGVNSRLDDVNDGLDGVNSRLNGVNSRLDEVTGELRRANTTLDSIESLLTPTGTWEIPYRDWRQIEENERPDILDQIPLVTDNTQYFSDPGEGPAVPPMPSQPQENYPVPIGESLDKDPVQIVTPPLSQSPSPAMDEVLVADPPLQVSPPPSVQHMTPQQMTRDQPMVPNQMTRQQPMAPEQMTRQEQTRDPVLTRNNFFTRQEVPGSD